MNSLDTISIKDKIITDVYTLKDIFNSILPIEECCKLNIAETGLSLSVIDHARKASIELELESEHISSYYINRSYVLYTDILDMSKILAGHDESETIEISLSIKFDEKLKRDTAYIMKFKVGPITHDISYFIPEEKEKNPDSLSKLEKLFFSEKGAIEISLNIKDFKTIIRDFYKFSDYILFETKDGRIRVSCISDKGQRHEIHAYIGENISDYVKCIFDLDYLKDMAESIDERWNGGISLYIGADLPMKIKFNVGRYGNAEYILVPDNNYKDEV